MTEMVEKRLSQVSLKDKKWQEVIREVEPSSFTKLMENVLRIMPSSTVSSYMTFPLLRTS